jgi:hypothetical protein
MIYGNMTQTYMKLGEFKNALEVCIKSITIVREPPTKYYLALSDILFSLEYYTESLRICNYVVYTYKFNQSERISKIFPRVTPLNFCFVCKAYGKSLKKCGNCKIVKYSPLNCNKLFLLSYILIIFFYLEGIVFFNFCLE